MLLFWFRQDDRTLSENRMRKLFLSGHYSEAEDLAERLLRHEPDDMSVAVIAARCAVHLSRPDDASAVLDRPPFNLSFDDPYFAAGSDRSGELHDDLVEGLRLRGLLALNHDYNLRRAEDALRAVLRLSPEDVPALTNLVRLLAMTGRRREAIPPLLRLIRLEQSGDLLVVAARGSAVIRDMDFLENARRRFQNDSRVLAAFA
ncbi:MAG: tetratricopeptide repeat protein, partial [Planctomycetaceae bacterium]|nr:tetratricopeptide repeat protein [Planctomycetaceae bacterium]